MHYYYCKNAIFQEKLTRVFQGPYPLNTRANLKNLGTILFLKAQEIQKSFYRLRILMLSFEMCVCLRMVENCKLSPFHTEDFGASFSRVNLSMCEL